MSRNNPFESEDLLRRIEANDKDHHELISIVIPRTDEVSYALFDRVGRALANSTRIRDLELYIPSEDNVDLAGWVHFLQLISGNRSITRFRYTSTFNAVRALSVNTARALRHVIERNDSLENVFLANLHRGEVEEFVSALASRETALGNLSISRGDIGDDGAEAIAEYLKSANAVDIHALQLSFCHLGARGLQHIAIALAKRDSPLQNLIIQLNAPTPILANFAAAFSSNPDSMPNKLILSGLQICEAGGSAFGSVLVRRTAPLECLELAVKQRDLAGVVGLMALLQVLINDPSKTPRKMKFPRHFGRFYNHYVGRNEAMLRNQMCSMEKLFISYSGLNAQTRSDFHRRITSICCNEASIDATYFSNHTLRKVFGACPKLIYYLTMNQNPNKKKVARGKVCDTQLNRNFQPAFFKGMKPSLLSVVLPFVNQAFADHEELTSGATTEGYDEAEEVTNNSLSIHFMLIKNHSSLFDHILVNEH